MTIEEKFWTLVDKSGECWLWKGPTAKKAGHGKTTINGVHIYAHRLSWEIHNGTIPKGLCVCHKCDNPPCVNPNHLFLGTRTDNAKDMVSKGRQAKGTKKWACRFTEDDIYRIRALPKATRKAAREFNLPWSTVWSIWSRTTWQHLP